MKLEEIKDRLDRPGFSPSPAMKSLPSLYSRLSKFRKSAHRYGYRSDFRSGSSLRQRPGQVERKSCTPMWKLIGESINKQAQLQKVNNFDAQVPAHATGRRLCRWCYPRWSSCLNLVPIRQPQIRNGHRAGDDPRHASGGGACRLSHWIVQYTPELGKILMVEPFRINFTLVAAI